MSFQDNCGTIVIDAVLTDAGRKRMAQGNFKVTKFALGDDEVDYSLFDVNASAASDEDLFAIQGESIVAQSCFEAFSQPNAVINYGLQSFDRPDLLYLPILKQNTKIDGAAKRWQGYLYEDGATVYVDTFLMSVNDETTKKILALAQHKDDYDYVLENNSFTRTKLVIESGIDNILNSSLEMRTAFILNTNMLDRYFNIYCDSRFFNKALTPGPDGIFRNKINGEIIANFGVLDVSTPVSMPPLIDKFDTYIARGIDNLIKPQQTGDPNDISAIPGPRSTATAINFNIKEELRGSSTSTRDSKFTIFGKIDQTLFSGADKYDYIDTSIYVEGISSRARLLIPLRIIRYAGT